MIKLPPISTITDPINRSLKTSGSPIASALLANDTLPSPADITPPSSIMKNSLSSPRGLHNPQRNDPSSSSSANFRSLSERSYNRSPISASSVSSKIPSQTSLPPISIKNLRNAHQSRTAPVPAVLPSLSSPTATAQIPPITDSHVSASTPPSFSQASYHQQPPQPPTPQLANPSVQPLHSSLPAHPPTRVIQLHPPVPHAVSVPQMVAPTQVPAGSYYPYPQYYHSPDTQVRTTTPKLYRSLPQSYVAGGNSSKKINGYKLRCECCMSDSTPEWRRGPNGARTLCNACGLYYAKVSKKKGPEIAAQEIQRKKQYKKSQKFLQDTSQYQQQQQQQQQQRQFVHNGLQPLAVPELPIDHHSHQQHQIAQHNLAAHPHHIQQQHIPMHYAPPPPSHPQMQQQPPHPGYSLLSSHYQGQQPSNSLPPPNLTVESPGQAKQHEQLPSIRHLSMVNGEPIANVPVHGPPQNLPKGGVLPPLAHGGYQSYHHLSQAPPPHNMVYPTNYTYPRYE